MFVHEKEVAMPDYEIENILEDTPGHDADHLSTEEMNYLGLTVKTTDEIGYESDHKA
jgi:hypothetical protein